MKSVSRNPYRKLAIALTTASILPAALILLWWPIHVMSDPRIDIGIGIFVVVASMIIGLALLFLLVLFTRSMWSNVRWPGIVAIPFVTIGTMLNLGGIDGFLFDARPPSYVKVIYFMALIVVLGFLVQYIRYAAIKHEPKKP